MKDLTEQIYDELNAQVIRMLEHARKQADRIAKLERENSSLAYELNVALSGGSVSIPSADTDKLREAIANISNNQITEAWESYGGVDGFYKSFGYQQFAHAILDLAADTAASTALEAPVREVPETHKLVPNRPNWNMLDALYGKGWIDKSPAEQIGMVQAYRNMLDAAALNLPAVPVQPEGE